MLRTLLAVLLATAGLAADNLLRNGDFAERDAAGSPLQWKASGGALAAEAARDGAPAALRIDIGQAAGEGMGAVAQRVAVPAAGAKLVLSGKSRSSVDGIAVLQVKLYRGGKELKRIDSKPSTTAWQDLTLEIVPGEADEIGVQARYSLAAKASGQQVWFAGLRLAVAP